MRAAAAFIELHSSAQSHAVSALKDFQPLKIIGAGQIPAVIHLCARKIVPMKSRLWYGAVAFAIGLVTPAKE